VCLRAWLQYPAEGSPGRVAPDHVARGLAESRSGVTLLVHAGSAAVGEEGRVACGLGSVGHAEGGRARHVRGNLGAIMSGLRAIFEWEGCEIE
jgi:hypothetical protein